MHPSEAATIQAFIRAGRRNRFLSALDTAKRRRTVDRFNHFHDWDPRYVELLNRSLHEEELITRLQRLGSNAVCYLISAYHDLDEKEMPLRDAVMEASHAGSATVICCTPGHLALYLDEAEIGPRRRVLLRR